MRLTLKPRSLKERLFVESEQVQLNKALEAVMLLRIMDFQLNNVVEPVDLTQSWVESRRSLFIASGQQLGKSLSKYAWLLPAVFYCLFFAWPFLLMYAGVNRTFVGLLLQGFTALWALLTLEEAIILLCRGSFLAVIVAVEESLQDSRQVCDAALEMTAGKRLYQLVNLLTPMIWGRIAGLFIASIVGTIKLLAALPSPIENWLLLSYAGFAIALLCLDEWLQRQFFNPFRCALTVVLYRRWKAPSEQGGEA